MTAPTLPGERTADVRALVLDRVLPRHGGSRESIADFLDGLSREQACAITLELLAETRQVIADVEAYADELARAAAQTGASHDERGAAVGMARETARRRWPWKAARW